MFTPNNEVKKKKTKVENRTSVTLKVFRLKNKWIKKSKTEKFEQFGKENL